MIMCDEWGVLVENEIRAYGSKVSRLAVQLIVRPRVKFYEVISGSTD